jgi:hypothetical protein
MSAMFLPDNAIRADGLVSMLRRHYLPDGRPPGGIFAAEIESPDGQRRADALWCPWSIAGGSGLVGHEVKVSRSDVLAELADPMKAEPWARYCSRWWLVVARPELVDGLAVPEAWGIMSPPAGRRTRTMTVLREAPKLKPADTGPGWRRVSSWEHYRLEQQINDLTWKVQHHEQDADYAKRQLVEREMAEGGRVDKRAAAIGRLLVELDKHRWYGHDFDVEATVAAILDLEEHRRLATQTRQEIGYLVEEARRMASPLGRIADSLAKLAKEPEA